METGKLKSIIGQQFLTPKKIDGQNGEPEVEPIWQHSRANVSFTHKRAWSYYD